MAKLVLKAGTPQAQEFELKPGTTSVGRTPANDLQIDDYSVSSSHAQIDVNGNSVTVKDLGSTNGTFINRSLVKVSDLQPGQMLRLGGVELLFQGDSPAIETISIGDTIAATTSPSPDVNGLGIGINGHAENAPGTIMIPPAGGGLRIAASRPAVMPSSPPLMTAPPVPPPIPASVSPIQPAGKLVCKFHPKSPGRWACPQCGKYFCDLCVGMRRATDGSTGYFCRPCGVQCSPRAVKSSINPLSQGSFYSKLPGAFAYPFLNDGAFLLVCGTLFFVVIDFLKGFSLYIQVLFTGYLFAYMQNVVNTTALGDESKADLPDVSNFMEDILIPCFQLSGVVLLSFGPAIGLFVWGYMSDDNAIVVGACFAMLFGCLYFPMAFLGVSMFDTVTAINPMLVVPAIAKMPLQYFVACIVLGVAFATRWGGDILLRMLIPIPIVPTVISSFVGLYFLTAQCRILGLLYFTNKRRLGWFNY